MRSKHRTGGAHGSNQQTSSAMTQKRYWSSLPDDLLGEVYARLSAPLHRCRFAAVCTSWRAAARTQPSRRSLPWLMLDPRAENKKRRDMYCPEDGTLLHRLPLSSDGAGGCLIGCHDGGWVVWSGPPLRIMNLFSGAEIALPPKQKMGVCFRKIIFSEAPNSHGCILAAITNNYNVAVCNVGCPKGGWRTTSGHSGAAVMDITFCNGELYGLTQWPKELNKFEIGVDDKGIAFVKVIHRLALQKPYWDIFPEEHGVYIVELCGRIVMAVRRSRGRRTHSRNKRGPFFAVFELLDAHGKQPGLFNWAELTSLGDHALFLGPTCSKVVDVPADVHNCPRRNHIYYSHHRCFTNNNETPGGAKEFFTSSNKNNYHDRLVYYKEDESGDNGMEGIMSVGYYVRCGLHLPMWILPPDL